MPKKSHNAIIRYCRNAFKQLFKGKKSQITVGITFIIILAISYYYDAAQYLNTTNNDQIPLQKEEIYQCEIAKISDGDSITVLCPIISSQLGKSEITQASIRIWGIDAPETKQAHWGNDSKEALTKLLPTGENATIDIKIRDKDQYNRYVSQLFFNHKDIGLEMVRLGQAVVYHQYNKDPTYIEAQTQAKNAKRGIWKTEGNQQDPASWRKVNPR